MNSKNNGNADDQSAKAEEKTLTEVRLERQRLMEEAASHLKGRRMTKKELAEDPYINLEK